MSSAAVPDERTALAASSGGVMRPGRYDLVLAGLVVIAALTARFDAAEAFNSTHGNDPSRLVGDEPGYHYLAGQIASGRRLDWPGRMPRCFLMVPVHRYHGAAAALVSGLIVAVHPGLITMVTRVLTEVAYVPLLLLVVAGLFELAR